MKKSKIIKKIIALLLILLNAIIISSNTKAANIGEIKDLERGEQGYYCVQKWNGSRWAYLMYNQTFYTDTDGQRYIAYCLSPGQPGVGYFPGEKDTYQVKINNLLDNDSVWRVLKNGYPNKSTEELGVETADDAYFATMQAINAILRGYTLEQAKELYTPGQFSINGENLEDIQRRGNKTLSAMFNLIDIGLNGNETRKNFLEISIKKSSDLIKEKDNFYSQTFTVQSSAEIAEYNIEKIENLPEGSYIADEKGNKKEVFNGNETFKVMIPGDKILTDISGKVYIKAKQKNYPVYYGASSIEGFQDYALCNNSFSDVNQEAEINLKANKSILKILKLDSETKKPIQGVKFQIIKSDGTKNEYTTDKDGKISISNLYPGNITIKEIQTVGKYKLDAKEIKTYLKYNETKEIKVENKMQKGNIKIIKVDAENEEIRLANVEFEVRDENNKIIKKGITDENGELIFTNLVIGKYKIIECKTKEEYEILNDEIVVNVEDGKNTKVLIKNKKIKIPEIIEDEQPKKELPKTGEDINSYNVTNSLLCTLISCCYIVGKFILKI